MHKYNSLENDHQKQANINQLFDSILTGKTIKIGTENNGVKWYSSNCPLPGHKDKKPSFSFNYSGAWNCFTCGKKGDAAILAKELNIDPKPYYNNSTHLTGVNALPRFDSKLILKVAHKKEYKYFEDLDYFRKTMKLSSYNKNPLAMYLKKMFGAEAAKKILGDYLIGTSNFGDYRDGCAIFWYADAENNLCRSKIMQYDHTGHKTGNVIQWNYHDIPKENRKAPLYGEWKVKRIKKPITIIESEKTAAILSVYDPRKLYLATGGISALGNSALDIFKEPRSFDFWADVDAFDKWNSEVEDLKIKCPMHHFRVFNTATLYEQNSLDIPPKADPADFYLDHKY
tara:strand:- start:161 stop:1186 length:1026 start_codon:yes stop_codon:yes gene_type:complete